MKQKMNRIYILMFTILWVNTTYSVPATPKPLEITQPDGTTIMVYLRGDEHAHYHTTEDNFLVKKDTDGFYKYLIQNENKLILSQTIARNISERTDAEKAFLTSAENLNSEIVKSNNHRQKVQQANNPQRIPANFPTTGSAKSLVILVNFKDVKFSIPQPQQAYTKMLNEEGYSENGGTGSARDYFIASSGGQFSPEFTVVGPYDLPQNMKYYGENDANGEDKRPAYMVVDACQAADADVDFTEYDTNNDGVIDNVFVYYAGYNEAEWGSDDTVWPHRWAVYFGVYGNYNGSHDNISVDGKDIYDYACTSELSGSKGCNMCGIGTFAHEFGHVIGMPDYYKTDGTSGTTLGNWNIMDNGSYNNKGRTPPVYSAYDRFYMGWATPTELTEANSLTLDPINQSDTIVTECQSYLIAEDAHNMDGSNPDPEEFFIVEYRKKTGWDAYLPKEGMLIWHIDYDQWAWDNNSPNNYTSTSQTTNSHMRVYLQPLIGNTSNIGSAFKSGSFTFILWNKDTLETNGEKKIISNITMNDNNTMTFDFMGGVKSGVRKINSESFVQNKQDELTVNKDDRNEMLYIFNVSGEVVYFNSSNKKSIKIPHGILRKSNIYLFKSGNKSMKYLY